MLFDTLDGAFLNFAYGWAFARPVRKVYYNLVITALSPASCATIRLSPVTYAAGCRTRLRWRPGPTTPARRAADPRVLHHAAEATPSLSDRIRCGGSSGHLLDERRKERPLDGRDPGQMADEVPRAEDGR